MKVKIDYVIKNLLTLDSMVQSESEEIKKAFGQGELGLEYGSEESVNMKFEPRPVEQAYKYFLSELPLERLYTVVTVYYFGRNGTNSPLLEWEELNSPDFSQEKALTILLGLVSIREHFEHGLSQLPMAIETLEEKIRNEL
ncbi:hypothetical protein [Moritella sp. Urea-trap-13]|uniref:hypothetical protein n=1 Tax=Moritella sp. Urea-trap-13 TaxID=2058327 RepID=UPI000C33A0E7|nr:hypothetical protein [Moritella sp. Urea-trap-13]PKH06695.1 hypothetical protein CXF93_12420 [Moritella sp. Urea-trap-13]